MAPLKHAGPLALLLVLSTLVCLSTTTRASSGQEPNFSYFLFVRQHIGTFCKVKPCPLVHRTKPFHFTIHGLWPNYDDGTWPQYCDSSRPFDEELVEDLLPEMEEEWPTMFDDNDSFWSHEWTRHGTCAAKVLPTENKYFRAVLDLHAKYDIAAALKSAGISPSDSRQYNGADIVAAIRTAYGAGAVVHCDAQSQLTEVWMCISRDMKAIDCPEAHHPALRSVASGPASGAASGASGAAVARSLLRPGSESDSMTETNTDNDSEVIEGEAAGAGALVQMPRAGADRCSHVKIPVWPDRLASAALASDAHHTRHHTKHHTQHHTQHGTSDSDTTNDDDDDSGDDSGDDGGDDSGGDDSGGDGGGGSPDEARKDVIRMYLFAMSVASLVSVAALTIGSAIARRSQAAAEAQAVLEAEAVAEAAAADALRWAESEAAATEARAMRPVTVPEAALAPVEFPAEAWGAGPSGSGGIEPASEVAVGSLEAGMVWPGRRWRLHSGPLAQPLLPKDP